MLNFQRGQTLRDSSDHHHLITAPYEEGCCVATCSGRAEEQFVEAGSHSEWDMSKRYLFPIISQGGEMRSGTVVLYVLRITLYYFVLRGLGSLAFPRGPYPLNANPNPNPQAKICRPKQPGNAAAPL